MSYSFSLTVKDGVVNVTEGSHTVHVPDGTFQLSGHEDSNSRTISITRCEPNGRAVVSSNSVGYLPAAVES